MVEYFICKKCQDLMSVEKVRMVKKAPVQIELVCRNQHIIKHSLDLNLINDWLFPVVKQLYLCPKCGAVLTDISQKSDPRKTELVMNCPNHSSITKLVSNAFWYIVKKYREQYMEQLQPENHVRQVTFDTEKGYMGGDAVVPDPQPPPQEKDVLDQAFNLLHGGISENRVLKPSITLCPKCHKPLMANRCNHCGNQI